jgi:endonuclease/exonuclease/phosphatase family metal-dependent hydrolase
MGARWAKCTKEEAPAASAEEGVPPEAAPRPRGPEVAGQIGEAAEGLGGDETSNPAGGAADGAGEPRCSVVRATPDAALLEKLRKRSECSPIRQREIFVAECAGGDAITQLKEVVATADGITVVSANLYYGRCVSATDGAQGVDPARTIAAIAAVLENGADVICLQEVPGGAAPEGQGTDAYPDLGDFDKDFPKASFDQWPEELAKLGAQDGVHIIYAPARNSTMYRCSFGNALVINTRTMRVDDSSVVVQDCLTEPTEQESLEGRAGVTAVVEGVGGGGKLGVCCTHLTEKVVGEPGQKQCEQLEALLAGTLSKPQYEGLPMVLCGDFNINNVQQMPAASAEFCKSSEFLHQHEAYDPYKRLSDAGFIGSQEHALKHGGALDTCWNAACVDYNGYKGPGVRPLAVGIIDPTVNGYVLSDHRWPVAVYSC